jgi:diaminopimelate decarboxylase
VGCAPRLSPAPERGSLEPSEMKLSTDHRFVDFLFAQTTPALVYDLPKLRRTAALLQELCRPFDGVCCFSVKANRHPDILGAFAAAGFGADVASSLELDLALAAGLSPIVATSPGLSAAAIVRTDAQGGTVFFDHREQIRSAARAGVAVGRHGIRIAMPGLYSSFGFEAPRELPELAAELGAAPRKFHFHCGEVLNCAGMRERLRAVQAVTAAIRGPQINMGGGYGVLSNDFEETRRAFDVLGRFSRRRRAEIIVEFGKVAIARCGFLITSVIARKERDGDQVLVLDTSAFNLGTWERRHLWRTSSPHRAALRTKIIGPTCYEEDVFLDPCQAPSLKAGDKLAFSLFGAYSASIGASLHGLEPPPEIFFDD